MRNTTTYLFFSFALSLTIFSCENTNSKEEEFKSETTSELSPLEIGQEIATKTQMILGKNLMNAINADGTEYAVSFCSTKAIHLTDSTGKSLNATVRRVSDRNRNPDNKANWGQRKYIKAAKLAIEEGKTPDPRLIHLGKLKVGYYPILTNQMCLQCHGQPGTDISPETLSKLNTLYPDDLATGYKPNELRGIWVVTMD